MNKLMACLVNVFLLVVIGGFFLLRPYLAGAVDYDVADTHRLETIQKNLSEAAEPFFSSLAFSGETLPYDASTSTFYLPADMDSEGWETGELTSQDESVTLLFEEDFTAADKQEAIANGTRFCFYAVRGDEYQVCYLVVTGLPVISIETEENADTEVFGGTAYFWDNSTKSSGWAFSCILEAHIRGNTSRTYPKKGYKLSLKKQNRKGEVVEDKRSLFGLRKDDEWILNAMYSDSSKIRDKLSIDIWNSFGASRTEYPQASFGTDATYVEVFFNHEYWGLYVLMEPVDSKQLDLTKEGEGGQEEYSYKSVTPQTSDTGTLLNQESYGQTLDGYELKGKHSSIDKSSWQPLLDYLKLRDLAEDETFAEEASTLADTENALDIWIYLQAVLGIDNRGKNMYYIAKSQGTSHKIYFAPWDMDITWGDALSEGSGSTIWSVGLNTMLYSERINWLFGDRLVELDVDGARDYVASAWKTLRKGVLSDESLTDAVDDLLHQVRDSGALARNEERWPESNSGQDYDLFKRMALYRMNFLDYYFNGNLDEYLGLGYE